MRNTFRVERKTGKFLSCVRWIPEYCASNDGALTFSSNEHYSQLNYSLPLYCIQAVTKRSIRGIDISYRWNFQKNGISIRFPNEEERDDFYLLLQQGKTSTTQQRQIDSEMNISSNVEQYSRHEYVLRNALRIFQSKVHEVESSTLRKMFSLCNSEKERARTTKLLALCVNSALCRLVQRRQSMALSLIFKNSVNSVQTEALTAAESLASLNEEFLNRMDSVPLQIGMKNISSLLAMNDFKLKMTALNGLRFN
jgi:hypothetical protein